MKKVLDETYDDLKVRVVITDGNGNSTISNTVNVTLIKSEEWELPIMQAIIKIEQSLRIYK